MKITILLFFFCCTLGVNAQESVWIAPTEAKLLKNPVEEQDFDFSIEEAFYVFSKHCVSCHGEKGKGDGPKAKKYNPRPADLTSARVQQQKDGEIFWKIAHGRNRMLSFRKVLNKEDRWFLVNYIRTLAKK